MTKCTHAGLHSDLCIARARADALTEAADRLVTLGLQSDIFRLVEKWLYSNAEVELKSGGISNGD